MENFLNSCYVEMWSLYNIIGSPKGLLEVQMFESYPRPTEFQNLHFNTIFECLVWTLELRSICLSAPGFASFLHIQGNQGLEENGITRLPNCPCVVPIPSHPWRTSTCNGVLENSRTVLSNTVATIRMGLFK